METQQNPDNTVVKDTNNKNPIKTSYKL